MCQERWPLQESRPREGDLEPYKAAEETSHFIT